MTLDDLMELFAGKTVKFGMRLYSDPDLQEPVPEYLQELAQKYNTHERRHQFMAQLFQQIASVQVYQSIMHLFSTITLQSLKEDPVGSVLKFWFLFRMHDINKTLVHTQGCCR